MEETRRHLLQALRRLNPASGGTISREVFAKFVGSILADGTIDAHKLPRSIIDDSSGSTVDVNKLLRLFDPSNTGHVDYESFTNWVLMPDGHCIQFCKTPYERVDDGKVMHLKGFGARLNMDSAETKALRTELLDFVASEAPAEVVWDGDSYMPDSFTRLLPDILAACGGIGKVRLVAFLREQSQARFQDAWSPLAFPITVYLQDNSIDFKELGARCLRATQSKLIVCFGGGQVVKDEFANASPDLVFHLFPASRPAADGSGTETTPLLESLGAPNLVVH